MKSFDGDATTVTIAENRQEVRKLSDVNPIILFFVIAAFWFLMLYYSIVPWFMGVELPRNKNLDISFLTIPLMAINVISTLAWFSIYLVYPLVRNKVINHQLILINSEKYRQISHRPLVSIIIPARNEENVIGNTVNQC